MGVDAVKSHQISSSKDSRRRRSRIHFPEGSLVEVRTDEEGFQNVYFSATVVPPPPPSTTTFYGKESRELLYVEYHNLVAEADGSELLREYVDVSFVRPTPPPLQDEDESNRAFQPGDVVDAFYMDGWWVGVVSRVVEGGERVAVTFQNPPDLVEFGLSDLRAHWDWVNGTWVKEQSAAFMMSMFGVGRFVEISLDKETYGDVWIPAIVHQCLGNGVLSVEYDVGEDVMAEVDSHNVRPPPLVIVNHEKKFVLFEKVDAYLNLHWSSGVIMKELENDRYVVFLKQINQNKEFCKWDLRPHMEWKDGKWLLSSFSDDGIGDQSSSTSAVDSKALSSKPPDQKKKSLKKRRKYPSASETVLEKVNRGERKQVRNRVDNEFDVEEMHQSSSIIDVSRMSPMDDVVQQRDYVLLDDEDNGREAATSIVPSDSEKQQQGSGSKGSVLPSELQSLPFVKGTNMASVWETIESMRVFQKIPQKPHFKPLENVKVSFREGYAISYMVTFARLVDRACSLKLNDPKGAIDEIMAALAEMEQYGFDVSIVQDRLTKLLDLKVKLEKLADDVNKIHNNISEHNHEKGRIEEEIGEINKVMKQLQRKLSLAESAKEKEDIEIATLQVGLKVTEENIKSVGSDFQGIVSSIL